MKNLEAKQAAAMSMVGEVHRDGCAEINGREYKFNKTVHKKRRKVYAFLTKVGGQIQEGDMSFLDTDDWDKVETVIGDIVTFDGMQLNKIDGHWDKYPEDYVLFVQTALGAISYPFLAGSGGA